MDACVLVGNELFDGNSVWFGASHEGLSKQVEVLEFHIIVFVCCSNEALTCRDE